MKRLLVVASFLFLLFAALIVQFYKLQIIEGDKWKRIASRQHHHTLVIPYERGIFYSNPAVRKGHPESPVPLVLDVSRFHLYADPSAIPEGCREEVVKNVQRIVGGEGSKLFGELGRKSRSRKLVMWIESEKKDAFFKWWVPFSRKHKMARNALFFVQDRKRLYPFGKLLGQLLHTVRSERDPRQRECIPTGGLELSLNDYLKGEDGREVILRSPRQSLDRGKVEKEPVHGADVYLTIDHHLQAIVEEEVAKGVVAAKAKRGWAILMEPKTGEILACAQYPFFEPEKCTEYFNDAEKVGDTVLKVSTVPFEPGSTIKPMTLAIALMANQERKRVGQLPLFSREEKIKVVSRLFPGRKKPIKELGYSTYANFDLAIQKSSNIYMATLVQRIVETLGNQWYLDQLEKVFGFGRKTGLEVPAESGGFLPRLGKRYQSGREEYSKSTPYSLAIGYNLLATPVQMIRCYGILANGGFDVKPTLIKKVVSRRGEVVLGREKGEMRRILPVDVVEPIQRGMRFTMKGVLGTGRRGAIAGYTSAGKSATAEKIVGGVYSKKDHISTFIGYAPAVNPQFVLSVVIDEPEYGLHMGGRCAAPVFGEIGRRTLEYLGVTPDDPDSKEWDKETKELQKVYDAWHR